MTSSVCRRRTGQHIGQKRLRCTPNDLDIFIAVQLLEDSRALLSLVELCAENEFNCGAKEGEPSTSSKKGIGLNAFPKIMYQ